MLRTIAVMNLRKATRVSYIRMIKEPIFLVSNQRRPLIHEDARTYVPLIGIYRNSVPLSRTIQMDEYGK